MFNWGTEVDRNAQKRPRVERGVRKLFPTFQTYKLYIRCNELALLLCWMPGIAMCDINNSILSDESYRQIIYSLNAYSKTFTLSNRLSFGGRIWKQFILIWSLKTNKRVEILLDMIENKTLFYQPDTVPVRKRVEKILSGYFKMCFLSCNVCEYVFSSARQSLLFLDCLLLTVKTLRSSKTSINTYHLTRCNTAEGLHL